MLNQSTVLSERPQFHPAAVTTSKTMGQNALRTFGANAGAAPQRRVPPKKLSCKTCQGKCCTGHCRF